MADAPEKPDMATLSPEQREVAREMLRAQCRHVAVRREPGPMLLFRCDNCETLILVTASVMVPLEMRGQIARQWNGQGGLTLLN